MDRHEDLQAVGTEVSRPSPVFVLDEEGQVSYVNPGGEEIFDTARDELEGRTFWDLIPDDMEEEYREPFQRARERGERVDFQIVCPVTDRWYNFEAYPWRDNLSVHAHDIENEIRNEKVYRLRERSLRAAQETLADSDLSAGESMEKLLSLFRGVLGTETAVLSRVDPTRDRYRVLATDTVRDVPEQGRLDPLDEHPTCTRVVEDEEALVLDDIAEQAPNLEPSGDVRSYLGAPVVVEGDVQGTFCFYSSHPRSDAFSDWEISYVEMFSDWAGQELGRAGGWPTGGDHNAAAR